MGLMEFNEMRVKVSAVVHRVWLAVNEEGIVLDLCLVIPGSPPNIPAERSLHSST